MKIHIITAFYRVHLIPTLIHYYEPMGIEWYPMVAAERNKFPDKEWIHPIVVPELSPTDQSYRKIIDFAETQEIIDDDYYGFLGDDDMFEPGFFDVIRQQTAKILVCSLYRGDHVPRGDGSEPHPARVIIQESLSDIRVCNIGLGMFIIKGEIFKQEGLTNNHKWDDGRWAERLRDKFPNDIKFLPDLFVFGAFFQPGRYTDSTKFLKPTWELPNIF
jgi:hypothetical protein